MILAHHAGEVVARRVHVRIIHNRLGLDRGRCQLAAAEVQRPGVHDHRVAVQVAIDLRPVAERVVKLAVAEGALIEPFDRPADQIPARGHLLLAGGRLKRRPCRRVIDQPVANRPELLRGQADALRANRSQANSGSRVNISARQNGHEAEPLCSRHDGCANREVGDGRQKGRKVRKRVVRVLQGDLRRRFGALHHPICREELFHHFRARQIGRHRQGQRSILPLGQVLDLHFRQVQIALDLIGGHDALRAVVAALHIGHRPQQVDLITGDNARRHRHGPGGGSDAGVAHAGQQIGLHAVPNPDHPDMGGVNCEEPAGEGSARPDHQERAGFLDCAFDCHARLPGNVRRRVKTGR